MFEKEIKNFKWKISDDLKISVFEEASVSDDEQECHFNIMKKGFNRKGTPEIRIDCSYQIYINKLRNNELFILKEILVSTKYKDEKLGGFILQVKGIMALKGITIRQRIRKLTNEEKQKRREIAAEARKKIKTIKKK